VRWHFIGGLQTTHCKPLARVPNLFCVGSVDSLKKAEALDKSRGELFELAEPAKPRFAAGILNVRVQVNTSGEAEKSGCEPGEETVSLCRAIEEKCKNLKLLGLMTIGALARSQAAGRGEENEDFKLLAEQRDLVVKELGLDRPLELSMGMSEDFEAAIAMGSDEVRIGSTIFGERPAKADAKVVES
jgi:PLP dependent protein